MITWLYPDRCPVCLQIVTPKGAMLHEKCKEKLDAVKEPICMKCGRPVTSEEDEYCEECSLLPDRGWAQGRSVYPYYGTLGPALRLVKKDGRSEFVRFFAKSIKEKQGSFIRREMPECIVPVPLHPIKKRMRGFNQTELLADALSRETNLPVRKLLKKIKHTKEQKSLSKYQRMRNVADAFEVDEEALNGKIPETVLLLDDVNTTGSTLTACAKALRARGVKRVTFLSVCVAEQLES